MKMLCAGAAAFARSLESGAPFPCGNSSPRPCGKWEHFGALAVVAIR